MKRTALVLVLVLAMLALAPAAPAEKGKELRPLVTGMNLKLPAGSFAAFRWDPDREGFTVLHAPPPPREVSDRATALCRKAPVWLREALERQIRRLPLVPVKVDGGPRDLEPTDANGDGLLDLVRVNEEGYLVYRRNRGRPGQPPAVLSFRTEPERFHDKEYTGCRPAAWRDWLMVGGADGTVQAHGAVRNAFGPRTQWLGIVQEEPFSAPALGDLDADGRPDLISGGAAGGFGCWLLRKPVETAPHVVSGLSAGACSVPCLVDLDGDGDLDLLSGNREGKVLLFRNTGTKKEPKFEADASDKALAALDVGDSSAPAAADVDGDGDVDLVVGNQAGELKLFLGPDWTEDEDAFAGLSIGELSSPCLARIDRGGEERLCLLVGRLAGDVLLYEVEVEKGRARFVERDSWSFTPVQGVPDVATYYKKSYFPEEEEVLRPDDTATLNTYLDLLEAAPEKLFDEVAFSIAHTPCEVLRTMARLGQAELLVENARAIYRMAERVDYAKLVEFDGSTTIAYANAEGEFVRAPRDVYYWWVVHPRILYEIPARVDASWWDVPADERGLTDSEWWQHKPKTDIHVPSEKARFWRHALVNDDRFGKSLYDSVASAKDLRDALVRTGSFIANGSDGVALMRFGYETQDVQAWQIYAKHYGSCGEHSIIATACARTMLIPASVITDRGEDHQWNEFWDTDGGWHHWDVCSAGNVDKPWGSTEGREHKGKTVSSTTRWRGDDRLDETTTTVWNDPEWKYTKRGKGYTDVAGVTVTVADPKGLPVDGALVLVRSHWDNRNMVAVWGYTDGRGEVRFGLGYEPNGGYTIEALTPLGPVGVTNFPVEENKPYSLRLTTPEEKPAFTRIEETSWADNSPAGGPTDDLHAQLLFFAINPPNLITGQRYRIASYLTEELGYRGTRCQRIEVFPEKLPEVLIMPETGYEQFLNGEPCMVAHRAPLVRNGRLAYGPWAEQPYVAVISNLASLWTELEVYVSAKSSPSSDGGGEAPVLWRLDIPEGPIRLRSGEKLPLRGEIRGAREPFRFYVRWNSLGNQTPVGTWEPADGEAFLAEWDTGVGGPLPPGTYEIVFQVWNEEGLWGESRAFKVNVTPSRRFEDQVIRQDDPKDPLKRCSWIHGPFDLDEGERFFLAKAKSSDAGFDMDMHLYFDKNGNGLVDGAHERVAQSTSPLANERIYLEFPKAGTYWLYCQGFKVEGDSARLDVEVWPLGTPRRLVDFSPVGRLREAPEEIRARQNLRQPTWPLGVTRLFLNGRELKLEPAEDRSSFAPARAKAPDGLAPNVVHTVTAQWSQGEQVHRRRSFSFVIDTLSPRLDLLSPAQKSETPEKLAIEVRAADEGETVTVLCRVEGEKERKLKPVKERPEVFRIALDTTKWPAGERFVWLVARDEAGNETERVLRVTVPAR